MSYTDSQINDLIKNANIAEGANQTAAPAKIEWRTDTGIITAVTHTTQATVAGTRQTLEVDLSPLQLTHGNIEGYANRMKLTANQYGSHTVTAGLVSAFRVSVDSARGEERVSIDTPAIPGTAGAAITLHLATGTEYSNQDIENLLRKAGFDYSVEMYNSGAPDGFFSAFFTETGTVSAGSTASPGGSTGGNPPSSPPSVTNINTIGWINDNPVMEVEGAEGVAVVYRFYNLAANLLSNAFNPINIGLQFIFDGLTVTVGSSGFYIGGNNIGLLTGLMNYANTNNDDWIWAWGADGNTITTTAKNPGAVGGGGGSDGQGLGKGFTGGNGIILQIGANGVADQRMTVPIGNMSASALGVSNVNVSTRESANNTISVVDRAISMVSLQRAGLGAMQNRLESTVNNLTVTGENLTAAESQIRDTDMAKEMIQYTKFNILQQAAQSMLAQANQVPQGVLQLLQ